MGMQTSASVEIGRPAAEVFRWLVEPDRLAAWAGGAGVMPSDPSVLAAGYESTGAVPGIAGGEATMRVDAWNPPLELGTTVTYAGGRSSTSYALVESGGATTISCSSETDWAKPDLSALEAQIAAQTPEVQAAMRQAMGSMDAQLATGAYDEGTRATMQSSLEASLARLKELVEAS